MPIVSEITHDSAIQTATGLQAWLRNFTRASFGRLLDLLPGLIALVGAFLVSAFILLTLDANPIEAFSAMWSGAFGNENATANTLTKATPILFVAIGITVAFRGGVINIGGEGQMITGALAGSAITLSLADEIGILVIPLALLAAFLAGGFFGAIAGFLKAQFDVNEILSTIMLNQVAVQLMNYLLNGPMLDPTKVGTNHVPETARIADVAKIPRFRLPIGDHLLFDRTSLHWGLLLAVLMAIVIYIFMWKTTYGFRIRAVGYKERAARYAGINVKQQMVISMFLAGGLSGLAGIVQVLGLTYRLKTDGSPAGFTGNAGFNGIVVALFGGLTPLGAVPASVFFGGLLVGAQKMQREIQGASSLITSINGIIVVFVVASQIFILRRARRRVGGEIDAQTNLPAEETNA